MTRRTTWLHLLLLCGTSLARAIGLSRYVRDTKEKAAGGVLADARGGKGGGGLWNPCGDWRWSSV